MAEVGLRRRHDRSVRRGTPSGEGLAHPAPRPALAPPTRTSPGPSRGPPGARRHHSPLPLWQRASSSARPCIPPSCSSRVIRLRAARAAASDGDDEGARRRVLGPARGHTCPHTPASHVFQTLTQSHLGLENTFHVYLPAPRMISYPRCTLRPAVRESARRPRERTRAGAAAQVQGQPPDSSSISHVSRHQCPVYPSDTRQTDRQTLRQGTRLIEAGE